MKQDSKLSINREGINIHWIKVDVIQSKNGIIVNIGLSVKK